MFEYIDNKIVKYQLCCSTHQRELWCIVRGLTNKVISNISGICFLKNMTYVRMVKISSLIFESLYVFVDRPTLSRNKRFGLPYMNNIHFVDFFFLFVEFGSRFISNMISEYDQFQFTIYRWLTPSLNCPF